MFTVLASTSVELLLSSPTVMLVMSLRLIVVPLIVTVEPFEKVAGEFSVISVAENE
jgi:hypothetical protein